MSKPEVADESFDVLWGLFVSYFYKQEAIKTFQVDVNRDNYITNSSELYVERNPGNRIDIYFEAEIDNRKLDKDEIEKALEIVKKKVMKRYDKEN